MLLYRNESCKPPEILAARIFIYCPCFAAYLKIMERHLLLVLSVFALQLVWPINIKPDFSAKDTHLVAMTLRSSKSFSHLVAIQVSLGINRAKLRMCRLIYACIMNYTLWPCWSPNGPDIYSLFSWAVRRRYDRKELSLTLSCPV